jgi:ribosome biogenesis GTPase
LIEQSKSEQPTVGILPDGTPKEAEDERRETSTERIRRADQDRSRSRRKTTRHPERFAAIPTGTSPELTETVLARIIASEGAFFVAQLENGDKLRVKTTKRTISAENNATIVAVGDNVKISLQNAQEDSNEALITEVLPRATKLSRIAAGRRDSFEQIIVANIGTLVIAASAVEPPFRPGIIDRYVVAGLAGGMEIVIVINKIDLIADEDLLAVLQEYAEVYRGLGYPVFMLSAVTMESIDGLRQELIGKTSVFAGHSGVGKSSIINALMGNDQERTGRLSKKYGRGAHTTSSSVLLELDATTDSYVADTPGVREFGNFEIDPITLKFFFVEFLELQTHCRITNCTHLHEPDCAVLRAVDDEKISIDRYASYVKLYEEAIQREKKKRDKT